jgi:hypothetical protein
MAPRRGGSTGLDFLSLSFVFIDMLALFRRFFYFLALLRVPDQTSSAAALFPGERVASVASQVRGFFPLSLATSEFGFSSRIWCSNLAWFLGSF